MTWDQVPGHVETHEAYGETTVVVERDSIVEACEHLRDELGFNFLSDISATDYLGWGGAGVSGYIGTATGRDLNEPMTQGYSIWPDTFGLACCAIEMMSIVSSRYDIARFGMEAFRSSPRQADLLIVSGRVVHKMAAPLRQIYDQMLEPKWVIAMGACASSGGMFNNYTTLQGVDKIVAVDIHVPGCPPRPEALMEGIVRLHEKINAGIPPAYEIRGVAE